MKKIYRKKILIVAYTKQDKRFLMVKDKDTNEWGFISGGVKKNETYYEAALRELNEETSGIFETINKDDYYTHKFKTDYRPDSLLAIDKQRNEIVESLYTIFFFPIPDDVSEEYNQFTINDEVIDIRVQQYEKFNNVWSFCNDIYNNIILSENLLH
jgi:8-oxo-dGTP pyrophosphatase MutT (NUDIX family)